MKVKFKTNLDNYQIDCFPNNLTIPPRKGEYVMVTNHYYSYYSDLKLPISLKVVDVIWSEDGVTCELWYDELTVAAAKLSGVNLF